MTPFDDDETWPCCGHCEHDPGTVHYEPCNECQGDE
jgi:hypothetical protein